MEAFLKSKTFFFVSKESQIETWRSVEYLNLSRTRLKNVIQ